MPSTPTLSGAVDARVAALLDTLPPAAAGAATVSVWVGTTTGETLLDRDAGAVHYAASTMKLPLVVAAYRRHERREVDLDAAVPVHDDFASALDGSRFTMSQDDDQDDETWASRGSEVTLRDLARRAIVRSSNIATNLLLERVGAGAVAEVLADAGCSPHTVLPRGIEDAPAREAGMDNLVTAHDLGLVLCGLAAGTLAEPATCAELEAVLAAQEHRDQVPAGLPPGTYVANKTGWVDGITHDVALVRPADGAPYVLAVCTTVDVPEETASALIADLSRIVWEDRV
ncbi:MAG: serine hydrolase [Nocardioides sp.]